MSGGGSGGGGGSASVTVEAITPDAAKQMGENAATAWADVYQAEIDAKYAIDASRNSWQSVLAGLIGTYAIVQQHELNSRMTDYAERGVAVAEEYKDLAIKNYDEVVKVAFTKSCTHWDRYTNELMQYEPRYLTDAFANTEYTPEYDAQKGRAMAGVHRAFDVAARAASRARSPYAVGACCDAITRLNIARANAMVALSNASYRYEDQKKIEREDAFFERKSQGMRVLAGISGLAGNMLTGSAANTAGALNAIGQAVSAGSDAYGQMANATAGMGDFWGNIGSGAFQYMGYNSFQRAGWGEIQNPRGSTAGTTFSQHSGGRSDGVFARNASPSAGGKLSPAGYAVSEPTVVLGGSGTYNVGTGTITP